MRENLNALRLKDLVENPTARVPICLCLDTSGSMGAVEDDGTLQRTGETVFSDGQEWNLVTGGTSRIDELQKGLQTFYDEIRADDIAQYAAEICIVTFDDQVQCIYDFATVDRQMELPKLNANGETHMGEGVLKALDLLEQRKQEYKDKGVDYYQPWLVLMTDGEPNGDPTKLNEAIERTCNLVNAKKLTVFPIGIGEGVNMDMLRKFSPTRTPLHLKGLKFKEFFVWLSQSVSRTSQSIPGETVPLDKDGVTTWGEL